MLKYLSEAIKNIRTNLLLNAAIIVLIVAVMTFLGIVTLQVQISGLTTEVEMKHEAFVELSQYRFLISGDDYINRLNRNTRNGMQPNEDDIYICYPLSKDPATNARFIANADRFWEFMQKMKSIPGVYSYFISTSKYLANGQHDAYLGYYVPDSTTDYAVTLDFFEIETLTYLKGRAPEEEDFYIDDDGLQVVPIVVGYQLRDTFELGDTVEIKGMLEKYNPEDLKQRIVEMGQYSRGKVVGILTQSNTVTISDGASFLYLYAGIIRAVKDPSPDIFPELKNDADAYIYASWQAIQNLATSKIYLNKANEEQAAEEIRKALRDTGLNEFYSLEKADAYAKMTASLEKGRTETYLHVALLVGMLCVFGLGILVLMLNIANTKDYAIHRLAGATKGNMALMTTVQMLILLTVSDVLIHYPYILSATGLFLNGDSMVYIFAGEGKIYTVIAILNIIILILTYIISRIYVSFTDFSAAIKDKE